MPQARKTQVESTPSVDLSYPADLYHCDGVVEPLAGLDKVDDAAIALYHQQGFLAVANAYDPKMVEDAKQALADLIAGKNEQFNGIQLERGRSRHTLADPAEMEKLVRKLMSFAKYDARLQAMASHGPVMETLRKLGGESMELFQEMALLKPPSGREKPWHQDHAYFDVDLSKHIIGVWIALDRATIANGCMHLIPGKHREPVLHFQRRDWQICDTTTLQIKDRCLAVPLEPGGLLFFDSYLPHGTPTNNSPDRRRALQFHYKPVSATKVPAAQRLAAFGSEGKDVSC